MTLKRDIGDARVHAAQVERYRYRAWWRRFSPTWWAAWTFALARPAETDACRLHDGRCSGACETTTETEE